MKITITAKCSFCARSFDAYYPDMIGSYLVCDDEDGRICCIVCMCSYCGRGHVTQDERDACDQFAIDNYGQDDPDAFRDTMLDARAGVI